MPGSRWGPMPVGWTSVKYMRHCFHRAATISRADEGQQAVAVAGLALAEQHVGLVDAVDRPVGRHLAADEAGEGRKEVHDREHRVRAGVRLDLAGPADEAEGPDRALGCFAQFAAEGTGVAHVRRSLVAHLAGRSRLAARCPRRRRASVLSSTPSSFSVSRIWPTW